MNEGLTARRVPCIHRGAGGDGPGGGREGGMDGWMDGERGKTSFFKFFFFVMGENPSPETLVDSPARGSHRAAALSVSYEFNTAVKNTRGNITFICLLLASLNAGMVG